MGKTLQNTDFWATGSEILIQEVGGRVWVSLLLFSHSPDDSDAQPSLGTFVPPRKKIEVMNEMSSSL